MWDDDQYDLVGASFDEFIAFIFDRDYVPIPAGDDKPEPWYWSSEIAFDSRQVADHYLRLFADPGFLRIRYTEDQLEQAFWAIQSPNLDCAVREIIWDESVALEVRERCVRSMETLFAELFSDCPLDTSVWMWWDSLTYDWHCGIRKRETGGEDESMQDVMFETLARILGQPSFACQAAALHGLGHLHHPETERLIHRYLEGNPSLDDDHREYALAAARFEVL